MALRLQPRGGVLGLTFMPYLEVQPALTLTSAVAGCGHGLAAFYPVSGLFQQDVGVAVQAHIAVAMVDDGH